MVSFSPSAVCPIRGKEKGAGFRIRHSGFQILSLPTGDQELGQIPFQGLFCKMGMQPNMATVWGFSDSFIKSFTQGVNVE